jgi:N utilization substance protein A
MINGKEFLLALDEIEQKKGISKESIIAALKEAMEKAYRKQLGANDDALVLVDIDTVKGGISMYQLKKVVEEVQDDFLEISLEDVKKLGQDLKLDDMFKIEASTDDLTKLAAINVKNILRQKLAEAEKSALFEIYKDKMGEMVMGVVEKVDERSAMVNIGRTSVFLPKSHCIPGENFHVGDRIKLYVIDVVLTSKGAQINVSRTDPGFLRRLFEEEIHEIYEGTVIIKNIAREAGERSKVAVYSIDPNVDPAGACIGPNGTRIQKIVSQLGSSKEKEKIDIITYNAIPGIFVMEALKPATVIGVVLDEDKHSAIAVIANGQSALAIGKRGVNARLAVKLTGWEITVKEQDEALAAGLRYATADDLRREDEIKRYEEDIKRREAERQALIDSIPATPKEPVADITMSDVMSAAQAASEAAKPVIKPEPVVTPTPAPTPEAPKPEKKTVIRTTKTLEDLERELEREKERQQNKPAIPAKKKYYKRDKKDEVAPVEKPAAPTLTPTTYMDIYSEEEIAEFEKEEKESTEEEVDFEEFEDYYDHEE